jgi:pyridoxine 5-phosphate synthase
MADIIATKLSVNLNKVALLRNQRDVGYPSVVDMARIVIAAGAHGITVHPRPDERHIRRSDVYELSALLSEPAYAAVEFNIEGNPTPEFMALAHDVKPEQVTLVPDSPEQKTSDHGWDFAREGDRLRPLVAELQAAGIRVSLFVDPDNASVDGAQAVHADRIELYTEPYAVAFAAGDHAAVLEQYAHCARHAGEIGLGVNAGHDLTIDNTKVLRAALPNLAEVSIGHAITADALKMGFTAAVKAYLSALEAAASPTRKRS